MDTKFIDSLVYLNNGNISTQYSTNRATYGSAELTFNYQYDEINRLINSNCSENSEYTESYGYDEDGNLLEKLRESKRINYIYYGGTNKLQAVFINGSDYYFTYDYRGNITEDGTKEIRLLELDRRNLPLQLIKSGNEIFYNYDDTGNRIYKRIEQAAEYYLRDHTGRELAVYDMNTNKLKMLNLFGNGLIGRINVYHDELPESMQPVVTYSSLYYIKDHLGSIRITVDKLGNVRNAQDYYPYGEIMQNFEYGAINEKYKFTEKERDIETSYLLSPTGR